MSEQPSRNFGGLDIDLARRIEAVSRRFEADGRGGRRSPIDDYLADAPEEGRPALHAELEVRDARSGAIRTKLKAPHPIFYVAFSPDGRWCGAASGNLLMLWELDKGTPPRVFEKHTGIAFSPDSQRLASTGADGRIELWDVRTTQSVLSLKAHQGWACALAFSPDGHLLASFGRMDHSIKVWDARPMPVEPDRP